MTRAPAPLRSAINFIYVSQGLCSGLRPRWPLDTFCRPSGAPAGFVTMTL